MAHEAFKKVIELRSAQIKPSHIYAGFSHEIVLRTGNAIIAIAVDEASAIDVLAGCQIVQQARSDYDHLLRALECKDRFPTEVEDEQFTVVHDTSEGAEHYPYSFWKNNVELARFHVTREEEARTCVLLRNCVELWHKEISEMKEELQQKQTRR